MKAESPRSLMGWADVKTQVAKDELARGVNILQVEYDLFDDHVSIKDEIINWATSDHAMTRPARIATALQDRDFFELIRQTIHATAVASIIKDKRFGLAPAAGFYFEPADAPQSTGNFSELVSRARYHQLQHGDIVSISLQIRTRVKGGTRQFVPIDMDLDVRSVINKLVREQGLIVFIAAGNSGLDLDNFDDGLGYEDSRYADCHTQSEAILVGYVCNNYGVNSGSNYGSVVELSAPAESVKAACYDYSEHEEVGDLLDAASAGFCRSSASTPMIAAIAACLQGLYKSISGKVLSKDDMLSVLRQSAVLSFSASTPLGVFPNFANAIRIIEARATAMDNTP